MYHSRTASWRDTLAVFISCTKSLEPNDMPQVRRAFFVMLSALQPMIMSGDIIFFCTIVHPNLQRHNNGVHKRSHKIG
ncbi:hypothetical protein CUMW_142970 [Citrus unshiu]|nr:hypothetical protein CUMW_142970 [Citrus unshiu]